MEENNITSQSNTPVYSNDNSGSVDSGNNKHLQWFKGKDPHILVGVSVLIVTLLIISFLVYWKLSDKDLFNKQDQSNGQLFNFSQEEKEGILKSLGGDSSLSDISGVEKHKELDQLSAQSENNPQLREFEKVDILNRLNQ